MKLKNFIKNTAIVMSVLFGLFIAMPWVQQAVYADSLRIARKVLIVAPSLSAHSLSASDWTYQWSKKGNNDGHMNIYYADRTDEMGVYGSPMYCVEPGIDLAIIDGNNHFGSGVNPGRAWESTGADYGSGYVTRNGGAGSINMTQIKDFVGKIIALGYRGTATNLSGNLLTAPNEDTCQYIATQILIWETVVGERDGGFNHLPNGAGWSNYAVWDHYRLSELDTNTYNRLCWWYDHIVYEVQNWNVVPSMAFASMDRAANNPITLDNGELLYLSEPDSTGKLEKFLGVNSNPFYSGSGFSVYGGVNGDVLLTPGIEYNIQITSDNRLSLKFNSEFQNVMDALETGQLHMEMLLNRNNGMTEACFYTCDSWFGESIAAPSGTSFYQDIAGVRYENQTRAYMYFNYVQPKARGFIEIDKQDLWTGENLPGAEFTVYSSTGDTVTTVVYDEATGKYRSVLPVEFGTYTVRETVAPRGYILSNETYTVTVDSETEPARISVNNGVVYNTPFSTNIRIYKVDSHRGNVYLSGAEFSLYKDENNNGTYDGGVDTVAQSYNSTTHMMQNVRIIETVDGDNNPLYITDLKIPQGSYLIVETKAPAGYGLDRNNNVTAVNISITNGTNPGDIRAITLDISNESRSLRTTLSSESSETINSNSGPVTLTDTVSYTGLDTGVSYTLAGTLMDRSTGLPLLDGDGNEITATACFNPTTTSGSVDVVFTVDASVLVGKTVVAFEELLKDNVTFITHADINDENQTLYFPDFHTTLTASQSDNQTYNAGPVTLTDTVSYSGLRVGTTYTVTGTLMDKETETYLLDETGNRIVSSVTFVATSEDGIVDVEFIVDASVLLGRAVVAFEKIDSGNRTIVIHADIDDEDQTQYFPDIGTTLTSSECENLMTSSGMITLTDTVSYRGLEAGKTYTVTGVLMDRSAGNELRDSNGNIITTNVTFTAESISGTVDVVFMVDASVLLGKTVVAFEELDFENRQLAIHADINDEGQTVRFPTIHTTLTASQSDNLTVSDETVILTDTVSYSGLNIGKTYTLTGVLMDRVTGRTLTDKDGNEISSSVTFVASEESATIDVSFTVDASIVLGKVVVAFETLYTENRQIAIHADINDENQTTYFPVVRTSLIDSVTGISMVEANKEVTLTDTVSYSGLVPGRAYSIRGLLVRKSDGEAVLYNGQPVTAELPVFVPETSEGTVDIDFVFDSGVVEGDSVVAYEYISFEDVIVASHEDINDVFQTVTVPSIRTTAHSEDGDKTVPYGSAVQIVDTVLYSNLTPGLEYTVTGTLYVKDTKQPLLDANGNQITQTVTFIAHNADGSIDVVFTIDSTLLSGKRVVAFENVYYDNIEVAIHADITDDDQTVKFPSIGTTATASDGITKYIDGGVSAEIRDVITYTNLVPGREYTVHGYIMDKNTNTPLVINDSMVTADLTFTPSEENGSVTVTFIFDASGLGRGTSLVVFEQLTDVEMNKVVAVHMDIDDMGQTVSVKPPLTSTGESISVSSVVGVVLIALGGYGAVSAITSLRRKDD